jgi:hypothetical protein
MVVFKDTNRNKKITRPTQPSNQVGPIFQSKAALVILEPWICDPNGNPKSSHVGSPIFYGILTITNHLGRKRVSLKGRYEHAQFLAIKY